MNVTSVATPVYADAASQSIRCTVRFDALAGDHTYLAVNGDAASQTLFDALVAGQHGAIAPYAGPPAPTLDQLRAHAFAAVPPLLARPRNYTLGGGVAALADASTATGADLAGLVTGWAQANPSATTAWVDDLGVVTTLTGTQVIALAQAVLTYGQAVYAELAAVMNAITSGAITTFAAIDAAAWPQ